LRIFVRRADGRMAATHMSPDDKIERLEQYLGHVKGGEVDARRLVIDGRRLASEETLRKNGVMDLTSTMWSKESRRT